MNVCALECLGGVCDGVSVRSGMNRCSWTLYDKTKIYKTTAPHISCSISRILCVSSRMSTSKSCSNAGDAHRFPT